MSSSSSVPSSPPSSTRSCRRRFPSTSRADLVAAPLNIRCFGTGSPIVALHGFTLTGAQFEPLADGLGRSVFAPDLPGHGETGIRPVTVEATVAALAAWMESFPASVPLLGYSQGARIALLFALEHPEHVSQLILVSGSSGISSDPVRARRRELDDAIAGEIETFGVDQFLDRWLTQPLTSTAAVSSAVAAWDRAVRSENTATGLAAALRGLGQGAYPYVRDRLAELPMPFLAVAGGRDQKYRALAVEMASEAPLGRVVILEAAGHNVVLEEPDALADAVKTFLTETSGT